MSNKFVFPKLLWRAVLERIVQDVPLESSFCEFECKRMHCTLETTGTCDIHPNLSLVMSGLVTLTPPPTSTPSWASVQPATPPDSTPQPV